jgi:hypothetical protein
VPAATDAPAAADVTQTQEYREEKDEIQREVDAGELHPRDAAEPYPATRYDEP